MRSPRLRDYIATLIAIFVSSATYASQDTIGLNGINSAGLTTFNGVPLTGAGVSIGQIEATRPGKRFPAGPDDAAHSNARIVPEDVFLHDDLFADPPANAHVDNHAEYVAGAMISTDATRTGVATGASLYASAFVGDADSATQAAESAQRVATVPLVSLDAINFSFGVQLVGGESLDGNALLTQFVDWSAARHDVLYVVAANDDSTIGFPLPTDNFNGITVAASAKETDGVYRRVADFNFFGEDAEGLRTSTDLLAPGEDVQVTGLNDIPDVGDGTSIAAPHVTGAVALLQQYGRERFAAGAPRRDAERSRRHELMKAVLLNSADKLSGVHGSNRTILDQNGMNWLQSEALVGANPDLIPLDDQMGAGHLNAARAVQQYSSGEIDSDGAAVPAIGWDYGDTSGMDDINKYVFAQPLLAGSYVSITIAWDRHVAFDVDGGVQNQYDIGDTFEPYTDFIPHGDDVINDLDIYFLPKGATDFDNPIALSTSSDSTIDHIFAQIPTTGEYEFWVHQWDAELGNGQDYAIAWWGVAVGNPAATGDYDGDGTVGPGDYTIWKNNFGSSNLAVVGNGNGIVDAADYTVWRDNLGAMAGSGSLTSRARAGRVHTVRRWIADLRSSSAWEARLERFPIDVAAASKVWDVRTNPTRERGKPSLTRRVSMDSAT